ncbi:hypothetical protein M514_06131 [Trichuris suis]|uniref:Thioredoxin domain-containing protein n=1 Tax=Trichuris suis TaxID=68888 RepID=A0A085NK55_9BILA|nr:hypothetical protein M514_06131 [Trichuris suis]
MCSIVRDVAKHASIYSLEGSSTWKFFLFVCFMATPRRFWCPFNSSSFKDNCFSVIIGSDVIGMKTVQEEKQILEELAISYKRLTVILHQAKWSVFCPESYAMLEKISTRYTQVGFVKVDVDEIRTVDHITTPVVMLYIGDVMVDILQETDIINLEKTLVKWLRIGDPAYRHHYTSELLVQNTASAKLDELMEVMNSTDIANAFEKNANFLRHIVQGKVEQRRSD